MSQKIFHSSVHKYKKPLLRPERLHKKMFTTTSSQLLHSMVGLIQGSRINKQQGRFNCNRNSSSKEFLFPALRRYRWKSWKGSFSPSGSGKRIKVIPRDPEHYSKDFLMEYEDSIEDLEANKWIEPSMRDLLEVVQYRPLCKILHPSSFPLPGPLQVRLESFTNGYSVSALLFTTG